MATAIQQIAGLASSKYSDIGEGSISTKLDSVGRPSSIYRVVHRPFAMLRNADLLGSRLRALIGSVERVW